METRKAEVRLQDHARLCGVTICSPLVAIKSHQANDRQQGADHCMKMNQRLRYTVFKILQHREAEDTRLKAPKHPSIDGRLQVFKRTKGG
jgi:hypothetical protein